MAKFSKRGCTVANKYIKVVKHYKPLGKCKLKIWDTISQMTKIKTDNSKCCQEYRE